MKTKTGVRLIFDSLLVIMLLGLFVLPISSMGLINVSRQKAVPLPALNSEVLSAQKEMREIKQTTESTQTVKSIK